MAEEETFKCQEALRLEYRSLERPTFLIRFGRSSETKWRDLPVREESRVNPEVQSRTKPK
jgi:hypothetical protein